MSDVHDWNKELDKELSGNPAEDTTQEEKKHHSPTVADLKTGEHYRALIERDLTESHELKRNVSLKGAIIPLTVNESEADSAFTKWVSKGFWQPNDLKTSFQHNGLSLLYIPFWFFEAHAESEWTGEYSQTHYRTVNRTRTVYRNGRSYEESYADSEPYQVWYPHHGTNVGSHCDVIAASAFLEKKTAEEILRLAKQDFRPTAGSEIPAGKFEEGQRVAPMTVNENEAREICKSKVFELEQKACDKKTEKLTGIHSNIKMDRVSPVYYPIWTLSYHYHNKEFLCIIPGTKCHVIGGKPASGIKVTIAIIVGLIVVAILTYVIQKNQ